MSGMYTVLQGDCLASMRSMDAASVQCCVTSPPYWGLRDYGVDGQIGLEETPAVYVAKMVEVFTEVSRVLKDDGTCWINLGDSYASGTKGTGGKNSFQTSNAGSFLGENRRCNHGVKDKDLVGIPWRVAFALQSAGWYLRSDIIWAKPNCMPESVTDRPTRSHEYIFLLTKRARYYYDAEAIKEACETPMDSTARCGFGSVNGKNNDPIKAHSNNVGKRWEKAETRNKRDVWTVSPACYPDAHFATFPPDLIKPCILAGSRPGDTILDPFGGSGTTGQVAIELGRRAILCELNPQYVELIHKRCNVTPGLPLEQPTHSQTNSTDNQPIEQSLL